MNSGFMFITSTGYDPDKGKPVKDPNLGDTPSLGACMTNIRRLAKKGDSIFVVSGKIPSYPQYIIGGLDVAEKIPAIEAYRRFPQNHLFKTTGRQLIGNIIVNSSGEQHFLDNHKNFESRKENYIVGENAIAIEEPEEVEKCRKGTMEILIELFKKNGRTPFEVFGRWRKMDAEQVKRLKEWLQSLKTADQKLVRKMGARQSARSARRIEIQPILF